MTNPAQQKLDPVPAMLVFGMLTSPELTQAAGSAPKTRTPSWPLRRR